MSLATRCTACGTVFRVVQDQLKVSEGWVRCGRCSVVFNALEGLFDLGPDGLTPVSPPAPAPAALAEPPTSPGGHGDVNTSPTPEQAEPYDAFNAPFDAPAPPAAEIDLDLHVHAPVEQDPVPVVDAQPTGWDTYMDRRGTPAGRVDERDRLEFPDAQYDPDILLDTASTQPLHVESDEAAAAPVTDTDLELPLLEPQEPHFVLHADRRARWNTPRMLALQGAVLALLLLVLGAQAANHFHDQIAARWPSTAPALAAWCAATDCRIEPPRRIDDLLVESTALTRAGPADAFKLSVVLRNRGTVPVMLPSVDLSLTDATGQQIARRMLAPRDFRVASGPLKAGAESPLQLVLVASGAGRVSGYTVELFYP